MTDGCQNEIFKFCICGHIEQSHVNNYEWPICEMCANLSDYTRDYSHAFEMDTLKYLEDKYEERTKRQSNTLSDRLRDL